MILSYKYRFCFLGVPKTASQSLHQALYSLCEDEFTPDMIMKMRECNGHQKPEQIAIPEPFFVFGVARHPVDRVKSCLRSQYPELAQKYPNAAVVHLFANPSVYTEPQVSWLRPSYVSVLKYETLEQDLEKVWDWIGTRVELPRLNVSPSFEIELAPSVEASIKERYADDMQYLGYN